MMFLVSDFLLNRVTTSVVNIFAIAFSTVPTVRVQCRPDSMSAQCGTVRKYCLLF